MISRYKRHLIKADYVNKEFFKDIAAALGMAPNARLMSDTMLFGQCRFSIGNKVMRILDNAIIADPVFEFTSMQEPVKKDLGDRYVYSSSYMDADNDNMLVVTVIENYMLEGPCLVIVTSHRTR